MPWGLTNRYSFTYYPIADNPTSVFLEADQSSSTGIRASLPYQPARAFRHGDTEQNCAVGLEDPTNDENASDPRRYRDSRMALEQIGVIYREKIEGVEQIFRTPLGRALSAWRPILNGKNIRSLAPHVTLALSACQLPNPTRFGAAYTPPFALFPFTTIWRVMLCLEGKISSDELLCEVFRIENMGEIADCIERIRKNRLRPAENPLRESISNDENRNDRAISWMALASCGWLLLQSKRETRSGFYEIRGGCEEALRSAIAVPRRVLDFQDAKAYSQHIGHCAMLPHRV